MYHGFDRSCFTDFEFASIQSGHETIRSETNLKKREGLMKITRDKSLVELTPESPQEAKELDALWRVIVDCAKFNKKLVPVGEYIPGDKEIARFNIED